MKQMKFDKGILILLLLFYFQSLNSQTFEVEGVKYEVGNSIYKTAMVAANCVQADRGGEVKILSTVKYDNNIYTVTAVREGAFQGCSKITSIILPETITGLGSGAFMGCSSLKRIDLPNSVTQIGSKMFQNCTSLSEIYIPDGVYVIFESAFEGCISLTEIDLPHGLTRLASRSFCNTGLRSVEIPDNTKTIDNAFYNCSFLEVVVLGEKMESFSFSGCNVLKHVYSKNKSPKSINVSSFESIVMNANLYVLPGMKSNYQRLTGWKSFFKIEESGIPFSITVDFNKDTECITIDEENKYVQIGLGHLSAISQKISGLYSIPEFIVYNDVEYKVVSIAENAFNGCEDLTSIVINKNIKYIKSAFEGCNNLQTITIDNRFPSDVEVTEETFKGLPDDVALYVPAGTYERYASHEVWGKFAQIIELGPISIGDIKALSESTVELPVYLKNIEDIAGLQFRLTLPNGVSVVESNGELTTSLTERSDGMNIMGNKDPDSENDYLFVALSLDGKQFTGNEGAVMNVKIDIPADMSLGDYEIKLEDIFMTTSSFETLSPLATSSELWIAKKYNLTYLLDGQEYWQMSVVNGDSVIKVESPVKEGYTFSGWSEIPVFMPSKDLIITGNFLPNKYQITYELEGNIFCIDSVTYDTEIITPDAPAKEWFSFNGWTNVPETMPADDLTLTGSYTLLLEMGDVNGDYRLSVVDVSILTNKILKKENEIFVEITADLNGDGRISIVDITMATNKIIEE